MKESNFIYVSVLNSFPFHSAGTQPGHLERLSNHKAQNSPKTRFSIFCLLVCLFVCFFFFCKLTNNIHLFKVFNGYEVGTLNLISPFAKKDLENFLFSENVVIKPSSSKCPGLSVSTVNILLGKRKITTKSKHSLTP